MPEGRYQSSAARKDSYSCSRLQVGDDFGNAKRSPSWRNSDLGEPGQQQYQPYPPRYTPPPRQQTDLGKFITKPLVAIGLIIGIMLVWLSLVILRFANGDESVHDFAYFLQFSGSALAALTAFIGGLTSTNFDGYERAGLLVAAGIIFLTLAA